MRINQKLIILFSFIALLPIGIVGFLGYTNTKDTITNVVLNQLTTVADTEEGHINAIIGNDLQNVISLSNGLALRQAIQAYQQVQTPDSQNQILTILKNEQEQDPKVNNITVLDVHGTATTSTNSDYVGKSFAHEEYFLKGRQKQYGVTLAKDTGGNFQVYYFGPLVLQGEFLGVIVLESSSDDLFGIVTDYSELGLTGQAYIGRIEPDGNAQLMTPLRGKNNSILSTIVLKDNQNDPMDIALDKKSEVVIDAKESSGENVLAVTRYLDQADWGLVVEINNNEAFLPLNHLIGQLIVIALIVVAAVLILSLYFAQVITNPINDLIKTVNTISNGDLTQRVTITSHDELGQLSESFNKMAQAIETTNAGLEEKVKEKTQQLSEKITELEKLNSMMVGRELKMIELKKEIEVLKKNNGNSA